MNAQAHISGHISGQVPNSAGVQIGLPQQISNSLPSSMQNFVVQSQSRDVDLAHRRANVREYCIKYLQRRCKIPLELSHKLPDFARRLEDRLFRDSASKEEYMNFGPVTIEQRLNSLTMGLNNSSHYTTGAVSTMIPTPGMAQNGNVSGPSETSLINSGIPSMVNHVPMNSGNLPTSVNVFGVVEVSSALNIPGVQFQKSYGNMAANISSAGGGNSNISSIPVPQPSSQMIPTPRLNNFQSLTSHSGSSNGMGLMNVDATLSSQQHRPFPGSQTGHIMQNIGAQIAGRLRPSLPLKSSSYGFPNGTMDSSFGLTGNDLQLFNGHVMSEGFLGSSYCSSPKLLQEHFDQQNQQSMVSTSMPQQMPLVGDGYMLNPVDLTGPSNMINAMPSASSDINNQTSVNPISLQPKLKIGSMIEGSNLSSQFIRQSVQLKPQNIDQSQNLSHQARHLVSQVQHQNMPNFQQHNFAQQTNQYTQQLQQGPQNQQPMSRTDFARQISMMSSSEPNAFLLKQPSEQFRVSDMESKFQQGPTMGNNSTFQLQSQLSMSEEFQRSIFPDSRQVFPLQQNISEAHVNFMPGPETPFQGQWPPQQSQGVQMVEKKLSLEQQMNKDFNHRITGHEEAQLPLSVSEGGHFPVTGQSLSSRLVEGSVDMKREQDYLKQRRWILLLLHARGCPAPEGSCKEVNCIKVQKLWLHMLNCTSDKCDFARCCSSRKLYDHYLVCRSTACPVCIPVRNFIASTERKAIVHQHSGNHVIIDQMNGSWNPENASDASEEMMNLRPSALPVETCTDQQSLSKRLKTQHISNPVTKEVSSPVFVHIGNQPVVFPDRQQVDIPVAIKPEIVEANNDLSLGNGPVNPVLIESSNHKLENTRTSVSDCNLHGFSELGNIMKQEKVVSDNQNISVIAEVKHETSVQATDSAVGNKSGKPKIKGVSMIELFTPEQVREHILGLRQWVGQSKAKAEKNQAMEHSMSENSCQLCAVEKLTFEPPPIYCTPCGARIKRNVMYYTIGAGETRYYFCIPCYNEARGDSIEVDGSTFVKSKLEKKRNDEETEEWWVQCDKCEAWQHQICALFNGRRNDGGQAEYTCPNCYIEEVGQGERMPLPQSAVLGAKDLPRTLLSDHIEQRLFKRLKDERQDRAKHLGKSYDEVPGAESLVIRVVSSVDKKLDVKQRFLEIFQEENYPTEFGYKSKVILLFQKIEGVEVCLFGMYVQEFGSDCPFPNQRRVYLSYLDSVKYFRPEIKTVTGEALRTFVYHEILIGYLEYCKKRGFTSCYIWACPPLKGEDYILYCHPEIQKTPKSDKLREWYLSMLRKAAKEKIVVDLTNLYDHFFIKMGECKAKVTAARLPYFDGDYWPGAAEDMINQLRQEEDGRNLHKKGKTKKNITKRALKAAGQTDLSGNISKDALLMQKLGETIYPMKEDFIMVHLQHACSHCCLLMVSGMRWVCGQCKNFQLCDKCLDAEQRLEDREKHPINSREKHSLCPIEINDVCQDTKDKDEILESEFFDTRQAFLSLCQGNHYQYDTLRRAKHSSMMVLYHLHNPTAPAFVTTCNVCHHDIEAGQGWRCEVCPDFDVCSSCYQRDGGISHPHRLTNHPSMAERDAQNKEARQKRVAQLRIMLVLLVHASQCRMSLCHYPNCRRVKGLFRHGIHCKIRATGGCHLCKKMWHLLQLHARACKESECSVPRCKDLKEHLRRSQQQSDSRRRAAVMEMMRQRAVEVAGNNE